MSTFKMDIGTGIIRSYKRLGYKPWYALAEFIDNSTQSYFSNRGVLDSTEKAKTPPLEIRITYDKETIQIADTAMGMSGDELERALQIGVPPDDCSGRSEYGLGMKTAACWFGDEWTIKTTKFGDPREYEVKVDVEAVADGNQSLPTIVRDDVAVEDHYTVITIRKLHQRLHHKTVARVQSYIRSMYRVDLRAADLYVTFNDHEPISEADGELFLRSRTGSDYRREFSTAINGKAVSGWVGILNPGARSKAGIAIIRRGRVIAGQPHAWRPYSLFGDARNDLLNQRLVGEIHLDQFRVSHTKDAILWEADEEVDLEDFLEKEFADFREAARYKKREQATNGPTELEVQLGISELREQMGSPEFADAISLQEVPSEAAVESVNDPLIQLARTIEPIFTIHVGEITCHTYLSFEASPNDPYFATDFPGAEIVVLVNANHPHFKRIQGGGPGVANYLRECVYDALAQWRCMKKQVVDHNTIKFLKDGLLRLDISTESEAGGQGTP